MNTIKVTFDSNVWLTVVKPEKHAKKDSLYAASLKIRQAITNKKIEAYLSETMFTLEAIPKKRRLDFFSSYRMKIQTSIIDGEDDMINAQKLDVMPKHPPIFDGHHILKEYFEEAIKLFRIIKLQRIGGIFNRAVEPVLFNHQLSEIEKKQFFEKAVEVSRKIESKGAGMAHIKILGIQYSSNNWRDGLKKVPIINWKKADIAVAEWADADSVATSIALGCDYFCTNDKARKVGKTSVFSESNLGWLSNEYGFKTISLEKLAEIL